MSGNDKYNNRDGETSFEGHRADPAAPSADPAAVLESGGDAKEEEDQGPPPKGPFIQKVIFIIMGTAELFFWNAVLSIIFDIRSKIYPEYASMTDTLNAVNNVSNLAVAIYCVKTGAMNQYWIMAGGAVLATSCLALAITTQWARGVTGVVLFHVINFLAGGACGLVQTGNFALSSSQTVPMGGYSSTGQGASGITSWILWMIISKATKLSVTQAMWVMMSIGFVIIAFSNCCYYTLLKRPEVNKRLKEVQQALKNEATNAEAPTYRFLLRQCWMQVFTIFWNFFISLLFFPNIGPVGWKAASFTDWLIGAFQIGDLVGRYLPNLLNFLVMKPKTLLCAVLSRTLFIPLAVTIYFQHKNVFFGHKAFQYILVFVMAVTNGWMATNVFINTPHVVKNPNWRSRVSSMSVVGLLVGISAGLWCSRIFTAIAN